MSAVDGNIPFWREEGELPHAGSSQTSKSVKTQKVTRHLKPLPETTGTLAMKKESEKKNKKQKNHGLLRAPTKAGLQSGGITYTAEETRSTQRL